MKDLIKKTPKELTTLLLEKRLALRNFRFAVAGSNVRNVKEGKAVKKEIAQILTLQNQQNRMEGAKEIKKVMKPVEKTAKRKVKAPKAN